MRRVEINRVCSNECCLMAREISGFVLIEFSLLSGLHFLFWTAN